MSSRDKCTLSRRTIITLGALSTHTSTAIYLTNCSTYSYSRQCSTRSHTRAACTMEAVACSSGGQACRTTRLPHTKRTSPRRCVVPWRRLLSESGRRGRRRWSRRGVGARRSGAAGGERSARGRRRRAESTPVAAARPRLDLVYKRWRPRVEQRALVLPRVARPRLIVCNGARRSTARVRRDEGGCRPAAVA